jgi:hypothetical protein
MSMVRKCDICGVEFESGNKRYFAFNPSTNVDYWDSCNVDLPASINSLVDQLRDNRGATIGFQVIM